MQKIGTTGTERGNANDAWNSLNGLFIASLSRTRWPDRLIEVSAIITVTS